jgi:hypothetical protein
MAATAAAASAASVGEMVAAAAAGVECAVALAALVDWQRGELSPSTAGSVASEGGGIFRHDGCLNSWADMDKWSLVTRRCKFRAAMELWSVVERGTKNRCGGRWSEVRTQFVLQHKIRSIRNYTVHNMVLYRGKRTAKKQRAQKVHV